MVETQDLDHFLDYAAAFLDSLGNYRVRCSLELKHLTQLF